MKHILILLPTTPQQAGIFLGLVLILDFITGLLASWTEYKKVPIKKQKKFLIESTKLRLTATKFVCYASGILSAWGIETVFLIRKIPSNHISTENLTLTTVVTGFFCLIEIYSVFFENIKRMGFDIVQKTQNIIREIWKLYKIIKNGSANN